MQKQDPYSPKPLTLEEMVLGDLSNERQEAEKLQKQLLNLSNGNNYALELEKELLLVYEELFPKVSAAVEVLEENVSKIENFKTGVKIPSPKSEAREAFKGKTKKKSKNLALQWKKDKMERWKRKQQELYRKELKERISEFQM